MELNRRGSALTEPGSIGPELWKLGREMVVIPAQLWMAAAELAGSFVLAAWRRFVRPLLARPPSPLARLLARAAEALRPLPSPLERRPRAQNAPQAST